MIENPKLIERPIVFKNKHGGYWTSSEKIKDLFSLASKLKWFEKETLLFNLSTFNR